MIGYVKSIVTEIFSSHDHKEATRRVVELIPMTGKTDTSITRCGEVKHQWGLNGINGRLLPAMRTQATLQERVASSSQK